LARAVFRTGAGFLGGAGTGFLDAALVFTDSFFLAGSPMCAD